MDNEKHKDTHRTASRSVPVVAVVDVLVVGGGFPGVCAAVGAARSGGTVAIVERDGMLGGQAAEVYTFGLSSVADDSGRQFVKGIPWEILQRTIAEGQSDLVWETVDFARMEKEGVRAELARIGGPMKNDTYINPNAFRYVLHTMVDECSIETFLEATLSDVITDGDRVAGVVVAGPYGPFAVRAGYVVDTTPQSAVSALAGHPFEHPEIYTGTHPRVAGVDIHRLLGYVRENPGDVSVPGYEHSGSGDLATLVEQNLVARNLTVRFRGFGAVGRKAIAEDPSLEPIGSGPDRAFVFMYERDGCGMYWIHSADWRHSRFDDPRLLSRAVAEIRKLQWLTHKLFRDHVPGFERSQLLDIHPHIARALDISREPGGLVEYEVPEDHITQNGTLYEDSVVRVRGHHGSGEAIHEWQLPYRSLIPKGLRRLLVTGKAACRSLHIHCTNAAVGHAAGVAAAVAAEAGVELRDADVSTIQHELERQGAVVF